MHTVAATAPSKQVKNCVVIQLGEHPSLETLLAFAAEHAAVRVDEQPDELNDGDQVLVTCNCRDGSGQQMLLTVPEIEQFLESHALGHPSG